MNKRTIAQLGVTSFVVIAALLISGTSIAQTLVTGRVSNGTAGGTMPSSMSITVVGLTDDGKETGRSVASMDPAGTFSFERPTGAAKIIVATDYAGITYSTIITDESHVDLKVFETTRDNSTVQVASDTLTIVQGEGSTLEFLQLFKIDNNGDRTFTGEDPESPSSVLRFPTVATAFDLSPGEGITAKNLDPIPGGFTASDPLLPGRTTASYLYRIEIPRGGTTINRDVFYSTKQFDLLVGPGLDVTGDGLKFEESVQLGDSNYRRYRKSNITEGSSLLVQVTYTDSQPTAGLTAALIAGITALIAAAIFLLKMRTSSKRVKTPTADDRERLIEAIARLDEEHERGLVDVKSYQSQRKNMKQQIEDITSSIR